jgi:hypothetical protein
MPVSWSGSTKRPVPHRLHGAGRPRWARLAPGRRRGLLNGVWPRHPAVRPRPYRPGLLAADRSAGPARGGRRLPHLGGSPPPRATADPFPRSESGSPPQRAKTPGGRWPADFCTSPASPPSIGLRLLPAALRPAAVPHRRDDPRAGPRPQFEPAQRAIALLLERSVAVRAVGCASVTISRDCARPRSGPITDRARSRLGVVRGGTAGPVESADWSFLCGLVITAGWVMFHGPPTAASCCTRCWPTADR